jgi:hypothetical protein
MELYKSQRPESASRPIEILKAFGGAVISRIRYAEAVADFASGFDVSSDQVQLLEHGSSSVSDILKHSPEA